MTQPCQHTHAAVWYRTIDCRYDLPGAQEDQSTGNNGGRVSLGLVNTRGRFTHPGCYCGRFLRLHRAECCKPDLSGQIVRDDGVGEKAGMGSIKKY
jgi:hypothetical protein